MPIPAIQTRMDATTTIERVQNIAIDRKESRAILAPLLQKTAGEFDRSVSRRTDRAMRFFCARMTRFAAGRVGHRKMRRSLVRSINPHVSATLI